MTHLAAVVQVQAVVGRAEGEDVGVGGGELHAANIGFGVYASHARALPQIPQPHRAVVAAADEAGGIHLQPRAATRSQGTRV